VRLCITHKSEKGESGGKITENDDRGTSEMINDLDYIELPDKRLDDRLSRMVEQFSAAPEHSIPAACGAWHEVKAAYRFF
jgi:hypothetical protein